VLATDSALELWLGEVKFYSDISRAIRDVTEELGNHTTPGYLRREAATIINKIDPNWPHADRLKKLLDPNTSLDQVFDAMVIPILLTYDSVAVNAHRRVTEAFNAAFKAEVEEHHTTFRDKTLPPFRIHLFLVPLKEKRELLRYLDEGLRKWQTL
jgi:Cap4 SAVED domain